MAKHLCVGCRERKARFRRFRGLVKADRHHVLCFECFRSTRDRRRAQMLAEVTPPASLRSPAEASRELTDTQIAHHGRVGVAAATSASTFFLI